MRTAIIDNYDSFTYNLLHMVRELGADCVAIRNDAFRLGDLEAFDRLLLSPGPGIPCEAGLLLDAIRAYAGRKPILGVCLGHQAIAEAFGGSLSNLPKVYHGVQTPVRVTVDDCIFDGLGREIPVGRYHSWVVDPASLPGCLEVTAVSLEGHVMALRHRELDIRGVQFHPESVLTPDGKRMVGNWLNH